MEGLAEKADIISSFGEVAEWMIAHVSKMCLPARVTGVRIPSSPLNKKETNPVDGINDPEICLLFTDMPIIPAIILSSQLSLTI